LSEAKPYSKEQQLSRGPRKYRRKVVGAKSWQRISDAKVGPCRVCGSAGNNGRVHGLIQLHHVVSRAHGGDDVEENIVPLCVTCHDRVTARLPKSCQVLCASLTDAEYAYAVQKCGESFFERAYGVTYAR
jgi:5-methylcytosine-specific restriction endonuclease McrA